MSGPGQGEHWEGQCPQSAMPIVTAMSTEKDRRLNESTSLMVIAEACLGMT